MKKKALSFLMVITLFLSLIPVTASATDKSYLSLTPQYGSNGKFLAPIDAPVEGSIPVATRAELEAIKDNLEGNYHLTADVDLTGAEWVPIGDATSSFSGTLDGQGHVIRNMTITGEGYEFSGLFGSARIGIFKNIGMEDININISDSFIQEIRVGGICGFTYWSHSIDNCYSSGTISVSFREEGYVGGISGFTFSTTSNCYNTATVSAFSSESAARAGGISGCGGDYSDINNCYNTGKISASSNASISYPYSSTAIAGGICGSSTSIRDCFNLGEVTASSPMDAASAGGISGSYTSGAGINNCYNAGSVFASAATDSDVTDDYLSARSGGICGEGRNGYEGSGYNVRGYGISGCFNTGTVSSSNTASAFVGGIFGYNLATIEISKCYNAGTVSASATDAISIGGIAGNSFMTEISDCYNTGTVTAANAASIKAGGICGQIVGIITNCYNIGQLSAAAAADSNIGGICGAGNDWIYADPTMNSYCLDLHGSSFGTLLTSEQMKSADSFVGFDFTNIWDISPSTNNGYPHLMNDAGDDSNHIYTVTVAAGAGGTATGGGTYKPGEKVTLTAKPNSGYVFSGWYEDGKIIPESGAVYEFSADKHGTLEARFLPTYSITVTAGAGGTATGGGTYKRGEKVTLVATPDSGYVFDGWYEDGEKIPYAEAVYEFVVTNLRTIEARFLPTYSITLTAGAGGTATGGGKYKRGEKVTLTAKPDSGYVFDGWYEDGKIIPEIGVVYEFPAIKLRTIEARFINIWKNPYSDVPADAWFYKGVEYSHINGLMKGTSDTTFEPDVILSRAMLATVLYRMEGEPKVTYSNVFSDVPNGQWYSASIIWASENGIVNGYGNGLFGTNDDITREQLATMIYRYARYKKYDLSPSADLSGYTDAGEISSWALDGVRWCVAEKLVTGMPDATLAPGGTSNRAQCATILMRFMENVALS